jgi:hypothetical protein
MDEAQLVELPDGTVMANMRNAHHNATCKCRGVAVSRDQGSSWGGVEYDPTLTSPVCAGTILRGRDGHIFFVRCSSALRCSFFDRRSHSRMLLGFQVVAGVPAYTPECVIQYHAPPVFPALTVAIMNSGTMLKANPASTTARAEGVVRRSNDGAHWNMNLSFYTGLYAYSCLTNMPQVQQIGMMLSCSPNSCA